MATQTRATSAAPAAERRTERPSQGLTVRGRRIWAASGLGFLAFTTAGLLVANFLSSAPYPSPFGQPRAYELAGVPASNAVQYFAANRLEVQTVSLLDTIAALSLLVFVAFGAGLLADRTSARSSALPWVALGAGSLSAGFWLLNALLLWTLSRPETIDAGLTQVMQDLVYLCGGPAHVLTLALYLGAVSAGMWGQPVVPKWIAWMAVAAAVPSFLSALTLLWEPATALLPIGRALAMTWILALSASLLSQRSGDALANADPLREGSTHAPRQRTRVL